MSDSRTFRFEKLEVWQEAIAYASLVYTLTKSFPAEERFGLMTQLRRAAVSISANLAEGTSRTTGKDFARFIEIAYGSLMETVSEATIAQQQSMITPEQFYELHRKADKLARMLSGLRSSLLRPKP
ncbi:MAG: four helix bundle protein [Verrucomicrobiota bacterium]